MTDQTHVSEGQPAPAKTYEVSIGDMVRMLINDLVDEANTHGYGDAAREKIRSHLKHGAGENTMHGITALSSYMTARAQERQATDMESIAKTASKLQVAGSLASGGQAIVEQRESRREYLSTTYSLPTETLSFLWSIRGLLVDASIKSLSVPSRLEPYQRLITEDIAWALRVTPEDVWSMLPRTPQGSVDFSLLEEFGIYHYGGTEEKPDEWMWGG